MKYLLLSVFLFTFTLCFGQLKVIDGDSIVLNGLVIRIANIDSPEYSQGEAAQLSKNRLKELLSKGKITYSQIATDKYGRAVCFVYFNGEDVGLKMVKEGYSFVHPYYCKLSYYYAAEKQAKEKNLGIWKYNLEKPWKIKNM